ncbi:MAG TPA: KTSC domain-containing protein [Pyrinomonadaceae bacterium]
MNRHFVSSSNLRSVGYDVTESILEIEFHSGSVYQYFNVPQEKYESLMRAGSKGSYFAAYIKDVYRYRRVR